MGLMTTATVSAVAKKGTSGFLASMAMFGIVQEDIPLYLAILVGLMGGTAAAWSREKQIGKVLPNNWLVTQFAAYTMIFVIILAIHDYPGLSTRWAAATAGLLSFASLEGLQAIYKKTIKKIDDTEI